jgi:hypothetical protein
MGRKIASQMAKADASRLSVAPMMVIRRRAPRARARRA